MKHITFEIPLESIIDRTGPLNVEGGTKTYVDSNGCEILAEDITILSSSIENSGYGQVKSTNLILPIFLEQSHDQMGLFTDFDFIAWSGETVTGETDEYTRIVGLSEDAYYSNLENEYVTGYTVSYLDLVTNYNVNNPYVIGLNLSDNPNTSFTGVIGKTGDTIQYVINGDVINGEYVINTGVIYTYYGGLTRTIYSEDLNSYIEIPLTEFKTKKMGFVSSNISLSELVKEEMFFGIVEKRNTKNDLFFDRDILSPFEYHLRMAEIQTVEGTVRYSNRFFSIT